MVPGSQRNLGGFIYGTLEGRPHGSGPFGNDEGKAIQLYPLLHHTRLALTGLDPVWPSHMYDMMNRKQALQDYTFQLLGHFIRLLVADSKPESEARLLSILYHPGVVPSFGLTSTTCNKAALKLECAHRTSAATWTNRALNIGLPLPIIESPGKRSLSYCPFTTRTWSMQMSSLGTLLDLTLLFLSNHVSCASG